MDGERKIHEKQAEKEKSGQKRKRRIKKGKTEKA